jgi:Zn-dependent M28 family amino/carboxypeptidase
MSRKKFCLVWIFTLLLAWTVVCSAQSIRYYRVQPDVIEDRLLLYKGKDAQRRITLTHLFEEVGCKDDRLEVQPVKKADAPNVICTLPGSSGEVIVVGAHFDRVDKGDGVADNWSGASLLPSLYQSLSSEKRWHTFVFIGFSDEEEGFLGSRFYADHLTESELGSIQSMLNLDTLGLDSTRVWASKSSPDLVSLLDEVAASTKLPIDVMNVEDIGNSDGSSFRKHNVPVLTLHSVTPENLKILHSKKDKFSAIHLDDYYDSYNLIASYLVTLDDYDWDKPRLIID